MKLINSSGLSIDFLENGSLRFIEAEPIRISLKAATPYSTSGANIYLRKRTKTNTYTALFGPESNCSFQITGKEFIASGLWSGIAYNCVLRLSEKSKSWMWQIDLKNTTSESAEFDLIYVQDIGLKPMGNGLVNEYYVSQYLERLVLDDENFGSVICCRQNMKEKGGHPWLMMASKNGATSGSTDGMQFYGKTYRETGIPEALLADSLGGNCAGESPVVALQEKPFRLDAGQEHQSVFASSYLPDHPDATSKNDLKNLQALFDEFSYNPVVSDQSKMIAPERNLFNTTAFLPVDELTQEELDQFFGTERRHAEYENGKLLSFFCGQNSHVMLREKELLADRPHAHIMQAGTGFVPDENIMSTTSFAFGVFNSHISQGNTNFNVLLSVCTTQFNTSPESGQHIFVELERKKYLLGLPSAFEIGLNHCRWMYKSGENVFQVRTWTSISSPLVHLEFKVLAGQKTRLLITHDFDQLNGWKMSPGSTAGEFVAMPQAGSMITSNFPEAKFRMLVNSKLADFEVSNEVRLGMSKKSGENSLFVIDVLPTSDFYMTFVGEVCKSFEMPVPESADIQWNIDYKQAQSYWQHLSLNLKVNGNFDRFSAIQEILPWYGMNAMTHFLTPYGLEQFSGAAWGTRDVSQGPLDLLLTMEKYDEAKQTLKIIFSNQNPDGGWPQWWMFDSYSHIRADDSHGDVFYWVIIALSAYIKVTGDVSILDEVLPYHTENIESKSEKTSVREHLDRLINMITDSFIPGTSLVPFGGGDWNDSLQPVSKELAERMISSWTVEMNYQAFRQYQEVCEKTGNKTKSEELNQICENIRSDYNRYLMKDGVVAGYGLVEKDGSISLMLHPGDDKTQVHYSILPMDRGIISEIFTKEQANHHQSIIDQHLKGPDGARLMDRPLKYQGGIQHIFQRAESSTFFGREIGLMYIHEHIRYAESQARIGNADAFVKALRQAIPVGYRDIVPCGDIRQSNCYYSSSDVTFKTRYEADELYDEIKTGNISLKGGWRVYSSGPGIYVSMVITRLLGIRIEFGNIIIDPVLPMNMDGLSVSLNLKSYPLTINYSVKFDSFGPKVIVVNGERILFSYEENKYRQGGAVVVAEQFLKYLNKQENTIDIQL
ncbi:MAG: GH36-type glycosyl hydrolase domain-containing protein [Bacteroidales bacterium]